MIRTLLLFLLLGGAMVMGPLVAGNKGYVLIALGEYTIEMSVVSAALFGVLLYVLLLLVENLLGRLFSLHSRTRIWLHHRRRRQGQQQTLAGALALAEGRFEQAEALMLKGAGESEQPLLNYISAAEAAEAQGESERRDRYLQQAEEEHPNARLALGLIRARSQLRRNELIAAEQTLLTLQADYPQHRTVLTLLKECLLSRSQWSSLLSLLPQLQKLKLITATEFSALQKQIYPALFAEKGNTLGKEGVLALWRELPKSLRHEPELLDALIQQLITMGAEADAEELLLESLRKHFQPALLPLAAKLQHPGSALTQLVEKLQSQLPETERAATMGFIYLQQKAYAQAQSALEQALQQQPTNRAVLLGLAKTMEQQRLFEKAVYYYQRATANH